MEACFECRKVSEEKLKKTKEKIFKQLREFLINPNNFNVRINPITEFYQLERM